MLRFTFIIITSILVSFYFFPIEFTFLPAVNTKMAMAGFGLILLLANLARKPGSIIDKSIFWISVLAGCISLTGLISVTLNDTPDYTYATYVVSVWVWLSGAYVTISAIRATHGHISVTLVCNYLIAVCTAQCILAIMIDMIPSVKGFVNTYVSGVGFAEMDQMIKAKRLYGIGATLDVAGSRFAAILCMISFLIVSCLKENKKAQLILYLSSFIIISIIGNMIARTTTIGMVIALLFFLYSMINTDSIKYILTSLPTILTGIGIIIFFISSAIYLYNTNTQIHDNLRFAFEGFFSMAETGEWDVHSNEILKNMIVFPESTKTWIIGDGYIENPNATDPYYVGEKFSGYYKATDIGYLRFIFYFGISGLILFISYIYMCAHICINRFRNFKIMFLMILAVNYIVWFKVSTDIFLVFALFLAMGSEDSQEEELEEKTA